MLSPIQMRTLEHLRKRLDNINPEDYVGENGLVYCAKCHTPKQTRSDMFGGEIIPCICDCEKQEMDAARNKRLAEEEEQRRQDRLTALRANCFRIPAMREITFDQAEGDARHLVTARRYVDKWDEIQRNNIGLLFFGNVGTGKSFAAQCVANALIDKGIAVRYRSAAQIISDLGDMLNDPEGRDAYLRDLNEVPLLIIDDVGAERDTAYSKEQLCTVIDQRGEARRPLIVTTNYPLSQIKSGEGDTATQRIFDRLQALCIPVQVVGDSKRGEIGSEKLKRAREILEL